MSAQRGLTLQDVLQGSQFNPAIGALTNASQNAYQQSYNANKVSGIGEAFRAFPQGGLIGAMAAGFGAGRKNKSLAAGLNQKYVDSQVDIAGLADDLDKMAANQQFTQTNQALIDEAKRLGQLPVANPDIIQRNLPGMDGTPANNYVPGMSVEQVNALMKGMFGASNTQYGINQLDTVDTRKFGEASGIQQLPGGTGTASMDNLRGGTGTAMRQPLNAKVAQSDAPPVYFPYAENMINQAGSVIENARTRGQQDKEFTQEFPGQDALRRANTKQAEAEARYLDSQRGYRDAQAAEQIIRNDTIAQDLSAQRQQDEAQAAKLRAEVNQIQNKPANDYADAEAQYNAAGSVLNSMGLIKPDRTIDQDKLMQLDTGAQGKAISAIEARTKAQQKMIQAGEQILKKESPGKATLEKSAKSLEQKSPGEKLKTRSGVSFSL